MCSPLQSPVQIRYLFSSAWFSFLLEFAMQEKKANQQLYLNLAVLQRCNIRFFCCQGHLKDSSENYGFCQKCGNDALEIRGRGVMLFVSLWCNYWKNGASQLWLKQYHNCWFLHNIFSNKYLDLTVTKQKSSIRALRKKLGKHVKQSYNAVFSHLYKKVTPHRSKIFCF